MSEHRICTCGAPFIPTPEQPDYCDFCVVNPEYRLERIRPPLQIKSKSSRYLKALRAKAYRHRHRDKINARRRQQRAERKHAE